MTDKKTRPTLGLAMIMKDEVDDLDRIVKDYGKYFDKIYVTATEKKTHTKIVNILAKKPAAYKNVELSYFKWIDHFGKARRYNQKQIKTDYWMWIDLDDEIEGAENIREVVDIMVENNLNEVWFEYDYHPQTKMSDYKAIQWRERIIRTSSKQQWSNYAVHENIDAEGNTKEEFQTIVKVVHRKTTEQGELAHDRNRRILEKDWKRAHTVPTAYYLGATYKHDGDYAGAIEKLLYVTRLGKGAGLRFLAWQNLFECYFRMHKYMEALNATDRCIAIDPTHPAPWYNKFAVYRALNYNQSAMQAAEIALSKRVEEESAILVGQDSSWYQYRGPFSIAQAYLELGSVKRAYELYELVKKAAPVYIDEVSAETGTNWNKVFEESYNEHIGK